jgi:hypothetical protein
LAALPRLRRAVARGTRCNRELAPLAKARALRRLGFGATERARVARVVGRDARLRRLLSGRGYRIDNIVPWTAPGSRRVLGGTAELTLSHALLDRRAALPDRCRVKGGTRERPIEQHLRILSADRLLVFAELATERVAIIRVVPPANVQPDRRFPAPSCEPSGD